MALKRRWKRLDSKIAIATMQLYIREIFRLKHTIDLQLTLYSEAGQYEVSVICKAEGGEFDAWNAWSNVFGCDDEGNKCYDHANAANTGFILTVGAGVSLWVHDSIYIDNAGGISLSINEVTEPETLLLYSSEFFGLVVARR